MQFTTSSIFYVLFAVLSTAWSAMALPVLSARDVISPHITYPSGGEVFKAGETITVTWDKSVAIGKPNKGLIVLGKLGGEGEGLDVDHPLASGFLLSEGSHNITFPVDATTSDQYIIDLFGDSGNISNTFTILACDE